MIVASGSNESGQKACAMITARPLSWAVSLAHLHVAGTRMALHTSTT